MREISDELIGSMENEVLLARITLDGWQVVENDTQGDEPIQDIHFADGSGGDSSAVSIGSTISASVTVNLEKSLVSYALNGREMHIELGMALPSGEEWFDMGTYTVTDVQNDDGTVIVTGMDAMVSKLDTEYEELPELYFEESAGISAKALVRAICNKFGLSVNLDDMDDHILKDFSPDGCTWRQLIGFVAALYGRFAKIGRNGELQFLWYQNVPIRITADEYYEDGLLKGAYSFKVSWLRCYNEVLEETLIEGNEDADQGIYFTCPWMTQDILAGLWEQVRGLTYAPVSDLTFFGDPRLEVGDAIRLICLDGEPFLVPVMGITHDWDGGLVTSVSSVGQLKSDTHEGPVQRETKRTIAKILKRAESIEMSVENAENEMSYLQLQVESIDTKVKDNEGNLSQLEQTAGALQAAVEDAVGNIAALQIQADEISGQVENMAGDYTQIMQTAGQVNVNAADENGTLETKITPVAWVAQRKDAAGKVTSSFHFDFDLGQFVFDGTGKFMAPDGKSYMTMDGGSFVLRTQGEDEKWAAIAKIGFSEDSNGVDYPYMLMGHAVDSAEEQNLTLVKTFSNGIYIGNAVPKLNTGKFLGLPGAVGFFVDIENKKTYNVVGDELYDAFTAVFG